MPFFEYECQKCGHITTFFEARNVVSPHKCEKCGSENTKRIFSTFGISKTSREADLKCGICPTSPRCSCNNMCPNINLD